MANGRNLISRSKRQPLSGAKTQSFYVDTSGIDGIADYLEKLDESVKEAIRPVAYAGARVIYERVKLNVAGMGIKTGNLRDSIYHAYMDKESKEGKRAMYRISWNVTKAPHGRLLEHGWVQRYAAYINNKGEWKTDKKRPLANPIQRPGYAFIRRAYAALPEAQAAMEKELKAQIQRISYYGA